MKEMADNNLRYSGPPTVALSYMNEFVVECPKCKGEALVTTERFQGQNNANLRCKNCMLTEKSLDRIRYKSIVKRNCDNCGNDFETVVPNQKEKVDEITIPCPHCGIVRNYKPKTEEYGIGYQSQGHATDPIFNLPLWFQADIRGDLFWAYNREHLKEIKSYVSSKLRERQTTSHTTMAEKLPTFIKDAKNRKVLVKIIERLERK